MSEGTIVPAYGRDYKSKAAALADWNAGKDFNLTAGMSGGYVNCEGANEAGMKCLQIRWKKNTMVAIIKKQADGTWK